VVRPQARERVRTRAQVVRTLRDLLHGAEFVEVETPILQLLHGGAAARPFVTHANALGQDLYLRIAWSCSSSAAWSAASSASSRSTG
jgi:lysyl-tRNA synthetase class 2